MYKQIKEPSGVISKSGILRINDSAAIPADPANRDANEFALWLKAGNIPEPVIEGEVVSQEWIQEIINKLLP